MSDHDIIAGIQAALYASLLTAYAILLRAEVRIAWAEIGSAWRVAA